MPWLTAGEQTCACWSVLLGAVALACAGVGMLGLLLSMTGGGSMDSVEFFGELLRQCREAHRAELLADQGNLF